MRRKVIDKSCPVLYEAGVTSGVKGNPSGQTVCLSCPLVECIYDDKPAMKFWLKCGGDVEKWKEWYKERKE